MFAALDYAVLTRYAITLTDLWPRLIHVVADDVRARIEDANLYLDFTLMMSFLAAGLSGVAIVTTFTGAPRGAWVQALWIVLALLACWSFYRLSISVTRAFVEHIRAAVDLFRLDLLDALSIQRPAGPADEPRIWNEIELFVAQGDVPTSYVRFERYPWSVGSARIHIDWRPSRYPRKPLALFWAHRSL
jgi:hypothetical protein